MITHRIGIQFSTNIARTSGSAFVQRYGLRTTAAFVDVKATDGFAKDRWEAWRRNPPWATSVRGPRNLLRWSQNSARQVYAGKGLLQLYIYI